MSKSKEEIELEKAVFGDEETFFDEIERFGSEEDERVSESESEDSELFFVDKDAAESDSDAMSTDEEGSEDTEDTETYVWNDEDEYKVDLTASNRLKKLRNSQAENTITSKEFETRLRTQFLKLYKPPKWTQVSSLAAENENDSENYLSDDDDEEIKANPLKDLLAKTSAYTLKPEQLSLLPTSDIDIQKLADVTKHTKSRAVVQSVCFHPVQPLVLTCGYDKTLRIYHIDGQHNKVVSSLYIQSSNSTKSPFTEARFHSDNKRVIAGLKRPYFFTWDLETGVVEKTNRLFNEEARKNQPTFERFVISASGQYIAFRGVNGYVNILNAYSMHFLTSAIIGDGEVADMSWKYDNLVIASKHGHVYEFNVAENRFMQHWHDPALVNVTSVAESSRWIALGTQSGVVSVYRRPATETENSVSKINASATIENLVTSVNTLEFSPDAQVLLVASSVLRDALRLVHVPSFSVFKNWPTSSTPLGHVSCAAFSPRTRYIAAGNEGGNVRLWSLNHYS